MYRSGDRSFDIIIPPDGLSTTWVVVQCESVNLGRKTKYIDREKVEGFWNRFSDLMEKPTWIEDTVLQNKIDLKNRLKDLKRGIEQIA